VHRGEEEEEGGRRMSEKDWWAEREKRIEANYTDTPHLDTYTVTVELEVTFAQENDDVRSVADAEEWLKHGDILESNDGVYEILSVKKKEAKA
jgi:hypothetical protein